MTLYAFNDPWYAGIIERFSPDDGATSEVAQAINNLARCQLVAACIAAQATDGLTEQLKKADLGDLSAAIGRIAESLEEKK